MISVYCLRIVNKLLLKRRKCLDAVNYSGISDAPTFIIGAPRSGSTALYQAITSVLEVGYIDNLSCALHNSLPFGFRLSKLLHGKNGHQCFTSNFGNTIHCGLNAPSECGQFWYRWLPKEKHFIDWEDTSSEMIGEIRSEIVRATTIVGRPIVFKNLNAGQRLRLISRFAPGAKIIHITRKIEHNALSILLARRRHNTPDGVWWSIKPPNYANYLALSGIDICTAQVKAIEGQIKVDEQLFPPSNWVEVRYEEFLADPVKTVRELASFIGVELRSLERLELMKTEIGKGGGAQRACVSIADWNKIIASVNDKSIEERVAENTRSV